MSLKDLTDQIKQSTNFQQNKIKLREQIQTDLLFSHGNGLFKVTPELLAFVSTWPIDELYLEDIYQNPVQVDKQVFLVTAQQHYQKVMNRWHILYEELQQIRKI